MRRPRPRIVCEDGVSLSVQVGEGLYCAPRNDEGPYHKVEVGFIQDAKGFQLTPPDDWRDYAEEGFPSDVYAYVPIEFVEEFIASHGGRKPESHWNKLTKAASSHNYQRS